MSETIEVKDLDPKNAIDLEVRLDPDIPDNVVIEQPRGSIAFHRDTWPALRDAVDKVLSGPLTLKTEAEILEKLLSIGYDDLRAQIIVRDLRDD